MAEIGRSCNSVKLGSKTLGAQHTAARPLAAPFNHVMYAWLRLISPTTNEGILGLLLCNAYHSLCWDQNIEYRVARPISVGNLHKNEQLPASGRDSMSAFAFMLRRETLGRGAK